MIFLLFSLARNGPYKTYNDTRASTLNNTTHNWLHTTGKACSLETLGTSSRRLLESQQPCGRSFTLGMPPEWARWPTLANRDKFPTPAAPLNAVQEVCSAPLSLEYPSRWRRIIIIKLYVHNGAQPHFITSPVHGYVNRCSNQSNFPLGKANGQ